jgi:hypothetical protein
MSNNPILEELYAARRKLLANAGGDAHKYLEGVRVRESASGRLLSPEELKSIQFTRASKAGKLPLENLSSPSVDR